MVRRRKTAAASLRPRCLSAGTDSTSPYIQKTGRRRTRQPPTPRGGGVIRARFGVLGKWDGMGHLDRTRETRDRDVQLCKGAHGGDEEIGDRLGIELEVACLPVSRPEGETVVEEVELDLESSCTTHQ